MGSSGPQKNNSSNLFDQSLFSSSNLLQLKNYNQTQNNIVFFLDEETTLEDGQEEVEGEEVIASCEEVVDLNDI